MWYVNYCHLVLHMMIGTAYLMLIITYDDLYSLLLAIIVTSLCLLATQSLTNVIFVFV